MAKSSRVKVSKKKGGRSNVEKKKNDFVKRKQKVGRKLLKPQNETITTFKSRAIRIVEQLAEKEASDNVTRKRYSMLELVGRFQAPNPNQKLNACSGVKELLEKLTPDQIRDDLNPLVAGMSRCVLDDDVKVRATGIKLIETLIDKVGSDSLVSHFTLLGRYLSCALVSLHNDVQASSLHLLHLLRRKAPSLLPLHANALVPNLLRLLGTKTESGTDLQKVFTKSIGGQFSIPTKNKESFNKNGLKKNKIVNKRTPTSDTLKEEVAKAAKTDQLVVIAALDHKQNTLMWQLDVFVLLTAMLEQVVKENKTSVTTVPQSAWQVHLGGFALGSQLHRELQVAGDGPTDCATRFVMLSQPDKLQAFCSVLLPLKHRLWKNMLPFELRGGVAMPHACAHCLWCLVDLQRVLSSMVQSCTGQLPTEVDWYVKLMVPIFSDVIINHFPFHFGKKTKKISYKKASKDKELLYNTLPDRSSDDLNVHIATIGVSFGLLNRNRNVDLADYVQELITSEDNEVGSYNMEGVRGLIVSLVEFFGPESSKDPEGSQVLNNLLEAVLTCYKAMHPLKKEKKVLLEMILIITDPDHRYICNLDTIRVWCDHLISEVSSSEIIPSSLVNTIQQLCLRRCPGTYKLNRSTLQHISENIHRSGKYVDENDKRVLIALLSKQ